MIIDSNQLEGMLNRTMQTKIQCCNCGRAFSFQEGVQGAAKNGITDKVVMCPKCRSVYEAHISTLDVSLGKCVSHRYPRTIRATADTLDVAFVRAQRDIPSHSEILERNVLATARKGLWGLGAKPYEVELTYKQYAQTIVAPDKRSQITVPIDWDARKGRSGELLVSGRNLANLEALGLEGPGLEVGVFTQDKGNPVALADQMKSTTEWYETCNVTSGEQISDPANLTINGMSAIQYRVTGRQHRRVPYGSVLFLFTRVEGATNNFGVFGSAFNRDEQSESILQKILETFQELTE